MKNSDIKILHYDIETLPSISTIWSLWDQSINYNQLIEDWVIACWSAKWDGESYIYHDDLYRHKQHIDHDDTEVVASLAELIEQADMIVAHNGDKFDLRKLRTRLIKTGHKPLAPVKQYDTLKVARKLFAFTSNRLDYLGDFLGVGRKIDTGGYDLWKRCLQGEPAAFKKMVEYNEQDVLLLEDVFNALQPWDTQRLTATLFKQTDENTVQCTVHNCMSTHVQQRGTYVTKRGQYKRYQCRKCGSWGILPDNQVIGADLKNILK